MVRNRNKMALYEVINRAKTQPVEAIGSEKSKADDVKKPAPKPVEPKKPTKSVWSSRPRMVSLLQGRIELSIPYQLAIAILLGVLLLLQIAFWFGQVSGKKIATAGAGIDLAPAARVEAQPRTPAVDTTLSDVPAGVTIAPSGSNHIVIQQFGVRRDLEPVMNYFSGKGVECLIIEYNGKQFLVTKNRYNRANGNKVLEKVKNIGAGYRAPTGFESFAPRLFSDAYLKKF